MSALMKEESKPGGAGQFAEFAEIINTMTKTGLLNQTAQSAGMQDMLKMILFAKELLHLKPRHRIIVWLLSTPLHRSQKQYKIAMQ